MLCAMHGDCVYTTAQDYMQYAEAAYINCPSAVWGHRCNARGCIHSWRRAMGCAHLQVYMGRTYDLLDTHAAGAPPLHARHAHCRCPSPPSPWDVPPYARPIPPCIAGTRDPCMALGLADTPSGAAPKAAPNPPPPRLDRLFGMGVHVWPWCIQGAVEARVRTTEQLLQLIAEVIHIHIHIDVCIYDHHASTEQPAADRRGRAACICTSVCICICTQRVNGCPHVQASARRVTGANSMHEHSSRCMPNPN